MLLSGRANALKRRDAEAVQTNFIAVAYRAKPGALRTIVDVSYAEHLMWDASLSDRERAAAMPPMSSAPCQSSGDLVRTGTGTAGCARQ